jgi:hypothetical protein
MPDRSHSKGLRTKKFPHWRGRREQVQGVTDMRSLHAI